MSRFYLKDANLENIDFKFSSLDESGAYKNNSTLIDYFLLSIVLSGLHILLIESANYISHFFVFWYPISKIEIGTIIIPALLFLLPAVLPDALFIGRSLFGGYILSISITILIYTFILNHTEKYGLFLVIGLFFAMIGIANIHNSPSNVSQLEPVEQTNSVEQKTIEKAIDALKKPYAYINPEITKLHVHNYFFYAVIFCSIGFAGYYTVHEYLEYRNGYIGVLFGDLKSVDFGSMMGISLFYGSPIIFLTLIVVYTVSQINKNLDKIHELSTQKHYIDFLASAFNSKTDVGTTDEDVASDIKKAADAIRDATIAKMLGKEPKTEEPQKEERYRDRLDYKAIMPLLTALLKSK